MSGENGKSIVVGVSEKSYRHSLSAVDCCCFDAVCCRVSALNKKCTFITIYRLSGHVCCFSVILWTLTTVLLLL